MRRFLAPLLLTLASCPILFGQITLEECRTPDLPFGGANGTPVSIVDTMAIGTSLPVEDLQIAVDITHPYVADIVLDVVSPLGTTLRLHNGTGGNADDLRVIFSDDGVPNASEPYDFGCFMQPGTGALSVFSGEDLAGVWSLVVEDDFPNVDDGVLVSWCLRALDSGVAIVPAVENLLCTVTAEGAELSWTNPVSYDSIVVSVGGVLMVLPGTDSSATVTGQAPGLPVEISVEGALSGGSISCPARCTVVPFGTPVALTERMVLVLIDGLRYSEGLGHPTRAYVPNMDLIAQEGTVIEPFSNDGQTITVRGIPAVMCGSWQQPIPFVDPICNEDNQYSARPYIHEYYRNQLDRPADDCIYVLGPYCPWRGSYHPNYGPDYWPQWVATDGGDDANWVAAQEILETVRPRFLTLYLPDVDSAGHSGDWDAYLAAIQNADAIIGELWNWLQQDPDYGGQTTLLITNDHGRHDYDFQGHGDGCDGCRTMQLLAAGPGIKSGFVSTVPRSIPDITPTMGVLLGLHTEFADGQVMVEILEDTPFVRGDTTQDGSVDLADAVAGLDHLFGTTATTCGDAHDANDDGILDVSDPIWTLGFLFAGGALPPPPFPDCAQDTTPDDTSCVSYNGCP